METVEHFARITLVAELLGGPRVLPRLKSKSCSIPVSLRSADEKGMEPGCPLNCQGLGRMSLPYRSHAPS